MFSIKLDRPVNIHFIGIGGISMSGLALVLLRRGFTITGSDTKKSDLTDSLEQQGVVVHYGQRRENITDDTEVVVFSAAVHEDNPEYAEALERGIPILKRAELLGQIMQSYPTAVAVAGTHGKTTTTSMLAEIFLHAGADPTVSLGGMLDSIGGNIRVGTSGLFLTEACEYTNSFLSLSPNVGLILNVRPDHLDFFADLEDVRRSFRAFAQKLPADGLLVLSSDIPDREDFLEGTVCRTVTFGLGGDEDYTADQISFGQGARASFLCRTKRAGDFPVRLAVPGNHNILNALAAIAAACELGFSPEEITPALELFAGTHRRFEIKGEVCGVTVVDDYAHHPDEIRATLDAAGKYGANRVICVFQPHTYTRTQLLMDEFVGALSAADLVVLADIYAAREKNTIGISSQDLADRLVENGTKAVYLGSFDEIEKFLLENAVPGDLLITMGAGDIGKVSEALVGK